MHYNEAFALFLGYLSTKFFMKQTLVILTSLLFFGCKEKEQVLEQLDKKSAREVTLTTVQQGDSVWHITHQVIWFNGTKIAEQSDTVRTVNARADWGAEDTPSNQLSKVPIYVTVQ